MSLLRGLKRWKLFKQSLASEGRDSVVRITRRNMLLMRGDARRLATPKLHETNPTRMTLPTVWIGAHGRSVVVNVQYTYDSVTTKLHTAVLHNWYIPVVFYCSVRVAVYQVPVQRAAQPVTNNLRSYKLHKLRTYVVDRLHHIGGLLVCYSTYL